MKSTERALTQSVVIDRARRGATEFGIMTLLFALYYATRGLAAGKESDAFRNAYGVMDLERRLGLFREIWLQAWIMAEPAIVRLLNFVYMYTHMTGLVLFGAWVFVYHQPRYREIRNIFLALLVSGLLVYTLFPLAPPRFFPYSGFVDTLALYSGVNYEQPSLAMLYNPFAAMPSLHVAFALFCGIGLIRLGRRPVHWMLGVLHPFLMITAVVGTGNHYILDAIAGSALTILAYLLVPRLLALRERRLQLKAEAEA